MVHGKGGLSTEDIAGLLRCLPSADEREMLQRHSARYAELGMAEQFMLSMMSIPQVHLLRGCASRRPQSVYCKRHLNKDSLHSRAFEQPYVF